VLYLQYAFSEVLSAVHLDETVNYCVCGEKVKDGWMYTELSAECVEFLLFS